ncbi:MAG: tetratricopeptide repeat protein [Rubrivivax sp.]|nr:tetratricopeptide repeat protein [Rubrivivax sp.]
MPAPGLDAGANSPEIDPAAADDGLSQTWPEDIFADAREQFRGLLLLDRCGLVSRERWARWAAAQARVAGLLGRVHPFHGRRPRGAPGSGVWVVSCMGLPGFDLDISSREGHELARQCLYHHAFEFVDVQRRPLDVLRVFRALRRTYGPGLWWMADLEHAIERHEGVSVQAHHTARDTPWLHQACMDHITTNVRRAPKPAADESRVQELVRLMPAMSALPRWTLARYRERIAGLPLPTDAQVAAFVRRWLAVVRQWPAPQPGEAPDTSFVFYLDPHAGMDRLLHEQARALFRERLPHTVQHDAWWMTTADYRRQFGYLNFASPNAPARWSTESHKASLLDEHPRTFIHDAAHARPMVWTADGSPGVLPPDLPAVLLSRGALVNETSRACAAECDVAAEHAVAAVRWLIDGLRPVFAAVGGTAMVVRDGEDYALVRRARQQRGGLVEGWSLIPLLNRPPAGTEDIASFSVDAGGAWSRPPGVSWSVSVRPLLVGAALRAAALKCSRTEREIALLLLAREDEFQLGQTVGAPKGVAEEAASRQEAELRASTALHRAGRRMLDADENLEVALLMLQAARRSHQRCRGKVQAVAVMHNDTGLVLRKLERFAEAVAHFRLAHDYFMCWESERHPDYMTTLHNIGANLLRSGEPEQGEAALRRALALQFEHRSTSPVDRSNTAWVLASHLAMAGEVRQTNGRVAHEEALELLDLALDQRRQGGLGDTDDARTIALTVARVAARRHELARALAAHDEVLRIATTNWGARDPRTIEHAVEAIELARRAGAVDVERRLLECHDPHR